MSKLIVTNIEWNMDEEDNIELSETIAIPEGMIDANEISDYLSEQTGYCHNGFAFVSI